MSKSGNDRAADEEDVIPRRLVGPDGQAPGVAEDWYRERSSFQILIEPLIPCDTHNFVHDHNHTIITPGIS